MKTIRGRTPKAYFRSGIPVSERPWYALTESQRELRLDTVAWHEGHDIFLKELIEHPVKRVRSQAASSNEKTFQLMIRAYKQGVDLAQVPIGKLIVTPVEQWSDFPKAPLAYEFQPDTSKASKFAKNAKYDAPAKPPTLTILKLEKILDAIIAEKAGPQSRVFKNQKPPPWATTPEPMPWGDPQAPAPECETQTEAHRATTIENPKRGRPNDRLGRAKLAEQARAGEPDALADGIRRGAIPENEAEAAEDEAAARTKRLAEIELIRSKLVINGRVRLDVEALAVYLMVPSYFAIATGLDPEVWQSRFLDSYALRLGCLASRQCGKSIITARKALCFGLVNPATTTLILAPTLRQSSELLLKISGVAAIAGLKIAQLSQFQLVLADKQPGALSRVVCLPGSNEDAGASTRGYASDLLILEEAAFLGDQVISSVLPSIAARPKAQLIGISSAGIFGSYFCSVMTSPQSRWQKMIVPAAESGRFTAEQLEELKLTLGARYAVEMECRWGSVGDSIYDEATMTAAFGTDFIDPVESAEQDPDSFSAMFDLEHIFTAQPFPRKVA